MVREKKYVTVVNFIPEGGLLYVDKSAPRWVCNDNKRERTKRDVDVSFFRSDSFYDVFRKRGNVVTVEEIFEEFDHDVGHFGNEILRDVRGLHVEYNKRWLKSAERMHNFLESRIDYGFRNKKRFNKVSKFLDKFPEPSAPDKALTCAALLSGNGNGILSADGPMMKSYVAGAKEFGVNGFVANAIKCSCKYIHNGKSYNVKFAIDSYGK